jgi:hypothetical protein
MELMPLRTPMAAPTIAAGSAGLAGRSTVVDSFATLLKPSANHTRCKQDIRLFALKVLVPAASDEGRQEQKGGRHERGKVQGALQGVSVSRRHKRQVSI